MLSSCNSKEIIVASAGDAELTDNDAFLLLQHKGFKITDSIEYKAVIEEWINSQVFMQEMKTNHSNEWRLINLRANLYSGHLAKYYIEELDLKRQLDTIVSSNEIQDYYNTHEEEFILHDYIVKALYLKIPKELDFKEENVHRNFLLKNDKDLSEINSYAKLYAENYYFNDSTWIYFNEVVKDIPITKYNVDNIVLNRSKTYFSDDNFTYFLNIIDFKLKNEAPPIDFLRNEIKRIIITHRLHDLKDKNESKLIQRIKEKHEINYNL